MDFRYLYTSFDGRINRKPFWIASLILMAISMVISWVLIVPIGAASATMGNVMSLVLFLVLCFPGAALGVKRLHDRNKPGSLIVVFIIPGLLLQLGRTLGITGSYQTIVEQSIYVPNMLGWILNLAVLGVGIWALTILGFLKGTTGANTYGPDPLASGSQQ